MDISHPVVFAWRGPGLNVFVELELLEFEVLIICFCMGCVSRRRDGR
jgi:hypothetical protein